MRAPLPAYNTVIRERLVKIKKTDVYHRNEKATLTFANRDKDVTDEIAELSGRPPSGSCTRKALPTCTQRHYADNADDTHPLSMRFYIDEQSVHINAVLLRYEIAAFRAYSRGTAAGGGSIQTSGSGGGGSQTSAAGGYQNITEPITVYTTGNTSGGALNLSTGVSRPYTEAGGAEYTGYATASHYHVVNSHRHYVTAVSDYTTSVTASTGASDGHQPQARHGLAYARVQPLTINCMLA